MNWLFSNQLAHKVWSVQQLCIMKWKWHIRDQTQACPEDTSNTNAQTPSTLTPTVPEM